MKTILVTGGAGYIGSVAVKRLLDKGFKVIVIDNLSKGIEDLVDERATFYQIDLNDKSHLTDLFEHNTIDAVVHFAAYKAVEESMGNATKYSQNISGSINLLDCMVKYKVSKIVFSSSAAVYGMPDKEVIDEDEKVDPINYYGYTKLAMEQIMSWYSKIHDIQFIALRYFNVAGDELGYVDPKASNIFPIIMEVIQGKREKLTIFGNDFPTPDGTCIRDYVDVRDLVDAHILALDSNYCGPINLGNGNGVSVKELIVAFEEVIGEKLPVVEGERRKGDPAKLVASNTKAKEVLKWEPEHSLKDMVTSTYDAYMKNSSD